MVDSYLDKVFFLNEKRHQEELREKYNPDNLFNNKTTTIVNNVDILKHMKQADVNKISKGFIDFLEKINLKIIFQI